MTDLIAVDVETTGLDVSRHVVIEVAAVNVRTGETLEFVPILLNRDLGNASPDAFAVNRYFERYAFRQALDVEDSLAKYAQLWEMLKGNTFAGANARFDALMLTHSYGRMNADRSFSFGVLPGVPLGDVHHTPMPESWLYRLLDLGSYAAGVLGENPSTPWSLNQVCNAVGVERAEKHTALSDANATAQCLRALYALAATNKALAEGEL